MSCSCTHGKRTSFTRSSRDLPSASITAMRTGGTIALEMLRQRRDGAPVAVLAERLRRRRADPDVAVFERADQRLEPLLRPQMDDGVDRRETDRGRLVGEREHELIGEALLAELPHQRDRLLAQDGIAVLRRQQQLVVIPLALDVHEDGERVQLRRDRGRLQHSPDLRERVVLDLGIRRDERRDRVHRRLLTGDVEVVELREEIVDRGGVRDLAERLDRQAADHRVVVIEERHDAADRLRVADHVQHANQQRHDLVFLDVLQRLENRGHRRRSEVDQRLRRDFRGVGLLEIVEQHRQRALVAGPAEELEDELLDVALRRGVEVLDERRRTFAPGNDSRNLRWMISCSACATTRGLSASAIRTSARSAVRFNFSSSVMMRRRKLTVPTSAIFPIASSTGLRSDFSA